MMSQSQAVFNESTTATVYLTTPVTSAPFGRHNKSTFPGGKLMPPRPTVSLDARPIVIPILSCVLCFPVLAFAVICALRYRAIRLRQRDQLKRVKSGCRSVTLEIPGRDKSSFYSRDSSSDPSLKGIGEISQAIPESPPLLSAPSTSGTSSRRSSKSNQHVKFMTTTAVFHGRTITGLNSRFKSTGKSQKIFWDEHSSHVECAEELEKELCLALNS
ncbi:hypothetical protein JTE90_016474 [Oedothorax gibbosus]|uniref:Uncharacterized protein n=1 Tax=Oedothorax gibbosus TaxID=931172 RepID=A0AAV6V6C0_9ARAC|nr:hypothetical protein JTE90_016474 [Oedothorax gibbosus]